MTRTRTSRPSDATVNTLAVTVAIVVFLLAYFAACMAIMLVGATDHGTETLAIMLLCATVATAWTVYRVYQELRQHDIGKPSSYLTIRLLRVFAITSRVPLLLLAAGMLAATSHASPLLAWIAAVPVAICGPAALRAWLRSRSYNTEILRGTILLTGDKVAQAAATLRRFADEVIDWCGVEIPDALANGHFCLVGATESGKTVALRLLMQSVLPTFRPGMNRRALIYDPKGDMLQILSGMRLRVPVILFHPFDRRAAAWAIALDVTSPAIALQVAYILIPAEENGQNAFFINAARDLLAGVFIALHLTKPGRWDLAEAVLILSDQKRTARLLNSLPQTRHYAREYFSRDPRVLANIESTITAHMSMIRPIAAMWSKSKHKISLAQWVHQDGILVLGSSQALRAPIDAINRVLFARIAELILSLSESRSRRIWLFLDEIKEAGRIELNRLATMGRSKGVRMCLAWQSIAGLHAVYGEKLADELAGMCRNKALLRTDCPVTAAWMAKILGDHELREWTRSVQRGSSSSTSMAEHIVARPSVLPRQFMNLPPAHGGSFEGYFITPGIGAYHRVVRFANRLWPLGNAPNFVPRPAEDQYLIDEPVSDGNPADKRNPLDGIGRITDDPDEPKAPPHQGEDEDDDDPFDLDNPL